MFSFKFQRSESYALAALAVEKHDVLAAGFDSYLGAEPEQRAAEYDARQQVIADANLDCRLHAGGHGTVYLAVEAAGLAYLDELGAYAEHQILVCENRVVLDGEVLLRHLRDMVAEGLVLVGLLNVALGFGGLSARLLTLRGESVAAGEPGVELQLSAGRNRALTLSKTVSSTAPSARCAPLASTKFMAGLPTKSATKRLAGR